MLRSEEGLLMKEPRAVSTLREAAEEFLTHKRIAVVGVSGSTDQPANLIYRTLRKREYEVFAVNPNAKEVEGDLCYYSLRSIPGGVDAALIATPAASSEKVARDCVEQGISHVWMHRSFGEGSVSATAAEFCRGKGIKVIEGGCPMMFLPGGDIGHKCMRWMLGVTGRLPSRV